MTIENVAIPFAVICFFLTCVCVCIIMCVYMCVTRGHARVLVFTFYLNQGLLFVAVCARLAGC